MKFTRTCLAKTLPCIVLLWVGCFSAVVSAQNLQSDPPSLTFAADPGHTAPLAALTITSTGAPISGLTFTIDKPAGSPNWLFLNPSSAASTPATILAIAYAYTLQDGVYRATINVTATGPPSRTLSIPVTFVVGTGGGGQNATLTAAPASLSFSGQAGASSPASQQINVTSTPDAAPFSVSTSTTDGRSWLGASPTNATAPATVTVSVNTTGLPAGSYSGTVTLTPTGGSAVQVPVTLSVASASGLVVTPASLDFSYTIGDAAPAAKTFQVTSTGSSPVSFTTTSTMTDGSGWLSATPASGTTPQAVTVTINSAALTTAGVYRGKVRVAPPGGNASASVDVPVTVTVTGSGGGGGGTAALQVAPTSLSFAGQVGGGSPAAQSVTVGSNPSGASVTVSATTASGGNWLQVSPASGTTALNLTVSANTSGLSGGVYSGTITITPASGTAVTIPVSLALTSGAPLAVGATNLQFYYTIGTKNPPAAQALAITGLPVAFKATSSTTDGTAWLTLSNTDGNIPGSVSVAVNPVGYTAGVYQGKVTVSAPSANISIDVPVTLYVSVGPMLIVRGQSAAFTFQPGGSNPDPQVISLDSSAQTLSYSTNVATSDGGKWLTVSPAFGTTPQNVTLTVNPEGLKPGSYSATIAISSPGATNTPVTVAVSLTVKSSSVVPSIPTITFNYQIGGTNQVVSQPLTVFSSGGDTTNGTATPAAANCPSGWLNVSPRTFATPATLAVTFDPSGIQGSTSCAGVIVLNANGVSNVVSVGANVGTARMLNVTPLSVRLYAPSQSSQPAIQNIEVTTTDGVAMPFTASASTSDGQPWLTLTRTDNGGKSILTVSATPASMGVGVYSGSIKITSPSAPQGLVVPVDLVVTPATIATADAASLVFTHTVRGTPPPAQTLGISTTSGSFGYKASVAPGMPASDYITISPATGSTPGSLSVGILPNSLAAGSYDGAVSVLIPSADTKPLIVPVRIIVSAVSGGQSGGGGVSADKSNLSFSVLQGATTAPSQTVSVTAAGGTFNMSASVSPNTKWLSVTPDLGTAPGAFIVSVNPTGLTAGRYNGTITLTSAGVPGSPITVNVQLDVTTIPVAIPQIAAVTNAASLLQSAIAPGELVAITGSALGPATPVQPGLTAAGTLDTTAGGTQVLFDDIPAPLMYVSADQINAIVPYEVAGRNTVRIRVVNDQRGSSDPVTKQVGVAAPGIFTIASNGRGQGAILNANNTPNGMNVPARTPATRGSVVQIFGTGEGLLDPAAPSGSISKDIRIPLAPVTAMVGGIPAQVDFAGAAPGAPGVFQINVRIPKDALTGEVPITINIGGVNSQPGVTVAISWL